MIVLIGLFISPVIGLIMGWFFMRFILFVGRLFSPKVNVFFRRDNGLLLHYWIEPRIK